MNASLPIIRKLQIDAADSDVSVSKLLRIAKIVATKLDLKDALLWIDRELNGYADVNVDDLPPYRKIRGEPKGLNPYRGWQTIQFESVDEAKFSSMAYIGEALGSIEASLRGREGGRGFFHAPYPPEIKVRLLANMHPRLDDVSIHITCGALRNIVDQVRNLILNWSLELEKVGILGEHMTFTESEKGKAAPVSQQFFIQNAGVVGNVSDSAHVNVEQTAVANVHLELAKVRDFVEQAQDALPPLPGKMQAELAPVLQDIRGELQAKKPDQSPRIAGIGSKNFRKRHWQSGVTRNSQID